MIDLGLSPTYEQRLSRMTDENLATLGVPVIALGVPTVIDAAALVSDGGLDSLFVTPRYIDSAVRQYARLLGYAINAALQDGLSVADMDLLLA